MLNQPGDPTSATACQTDLTNHLETVMTTLKRRRTATLIYTSTTALAYLLAFSTPLVNGITITALLILGAGTYATWRVQQMPPPPARPVEPAISTTLATVEQDSNAA